MKRLQGFQGERASVAHAAKRSRKADRRSTPLAAVIAAIACAKRAPDVAAALQSYDRRALKAGSFPVDLENALLAAADRINQGLNATSPARLTVDTVHTGLGSDVTLPASLESLSARGGDALLNAYAPGDIYLGFAEPRDTLLRRVLASLPEKIATAYADPVVYAWILEKALPGQGRALWFFQQSRRDALEHDDVRERRDNGVSDLVDAFDAYVRAVDPGRAEKIRLAVRQFVTEANEFGSAAAASDLLIKRLCKTFIEFKVQQGNTIHVVTDRVTWETVGLKGRKDAHALFTPSELKRLARLPESKTKFYMDGKAIEPPTGMKTLRGVMRARKPRQG